MAATVYGDGNYGAADESLKGLYIAEMRLEASEDEAFAKNHIGEDIGLSLYNRQASMTGRGLTVTANTQGQTLGGAIDVAATDLYGTDSGVTAFYIKSIELGDVQDNFQEGSFTAIGRTGITGAGSEVS